MGSKQSVFTEEQLDEYQDCTVFTRKEILSIKPRRPSPVLPYYCDQGNCSLKCLAEYCLTKQYNNEADIVQKTVPANIIEVKLYHRYHALAPEIVPRYFNDSADIKLPLELISEMPELKENPFHQKLLQVFSEDKQDNMSFNDFLNMFSILSDLTPQHLKAYYAFKVYDFNSDNFICQSDLEVMLGKLTGDDELSHEEVQLVCHKIMEEGDLDGDGKLSFADFEYMITRAPDFMSTFHIRI